MTEEVKNAAGEQENKTQNPGTEAPKAEETQETIGDVLNTKPAEKKEETVPLSTFLELKKDNKDLARQMKELQKSIEQGASKKEVSADLKALADKHNVDADFLQEFAEAVRANAEKEVEEKVNSKLKPLEEKEKADKINDAFNTHYEKALKQVPEYEGIVNKEIIKALTLNPANAQKTFIQIIEEAYGHLITGKRTLDVATTRAGKNDSQEVDLDKAKKDQEYFKEVMANPVLKKKYNEKLTDRLASYI